MKQRSSNFELMRIVSMIFIVTGHTLSWGGITNSTDVFFKLVIYIIYALIAVHVNSFIILTGYYQSQSKFKIKKVLNLILLMFLYRIICCLLGMWMGWIQYNGIKELLIKLLPLSDFSYWYLNVYTILYLISPYLNNLINNIDKKKYNVLLIIIFIFCSVLTRVTMQEFISNNDGYSLVQFIFMYLIGAYLRKYKETIKIKIFNKKITLSNKVNIFFVLYFVIGIIKFLLNYFGTKSANIDFLPEFIAVRLRYSFDRIIYDDPLVILQSVAFFLMFKSIKLENKLINFFSKSTNEIYLFHMNNSFRTNLYLALGVNLNYYSVRNIPTIIFVIIKIYLVGTIIYFIRTFTLKLLLKNKYIKKAGMFIEKKLDKIDEFMNN